MIANAIFRALLLTAAAKVHGQYPTRDVAIYATPGGKGRCYGDLGHPGPEWHDCDVPAGFAFESSPPAHSGAWVVYRGAKTGAKRP